MFAKFTLAFLVAMAIGEPLAAQTGFRSLTGSVSDARGNALPGAVVHIENTSDLTVRTYITDKSGRYCFNNLAENADYTVFVKYRKWRSETKTLSKFDSKQHPAVNLKIPID